jgi:hypothetical protein
VRRPRRYRVATAGHAPARPRESHRRIGALPTGADVFPWKVGELIEGPPPNRSSVMERITTLYGRGEPEDPGR